MMWHSMPKGDASFRTSLSEPLKTETRRNRTGSGLRLETARTRTILTASACSSGAYGAIGMKLRISSAICAGMPRCFREQGPQRGSRRRQISRVFHLHGEEGRPALPAGLRLYDERGALRRRAVLRRARGSAKRRSPCSTESGPRAPGEGGRFQARAKPFARARASLAGKVIFISSRFAGTVGV